MLSHSSVQVVRAGLGFYDANGARLDSDNLSDSSFDIPPCYTDTIYPHLPSRKWPLTLVNGIAVPLPKAQVTPMLHQSYYQFSNGLILHFIAWSSGRLDDPKHHKDICCSTCGRASQAFLFAKESDDPTMEDVHRVSATLTEKDIIQLAMEIGFAYRTVDYSPIRLAELTVPPVFPGSLHRNRQFVINRQPSPCSTCVSGRCNEKHAIVALRQAVITGTLANREIKDGYVIPVTGYPKSVTHAVGGTLPPDFRDLYFLFFYHEVYYEDGLVMRIVWEAEWFGILHELMAKEAGSTHSSGKHCDCCGTIRTHDEYSRYRTRCLAGGTNWGDFQDLDWKFQTRHNGITITMEKDVVEEMKNNSAAKVK